MPGVWRERGCQCFFFWSNERNEPPHVHVEAGDGHAKVWLAPVVLAQSIGFDAGAVRDLLCMVREHRAEGWLGVKNGPLLEAMAERGCGSW